ncbi:uncharacterized protein LOC124320928 isoform X3 [Daphnia pulicaria]|uniref:uncharacterized protein LOC124320928 isoform X3 n=1 Tax=Daphnia pulicaria TaxID=35523 RepID=UPI001EECA349|nr:uncharacterized protein LOC124320928 isoform X3 [Daphnia pulicaria]
MDSKFAGRFSVVVFILITLTTGLMKALFPAVYDLIGSSCLVLAGLSVIAICIIYCVIPNIHSNSLSNKSKADSTPKTSKESHTCNSTTVLMEEKPQLLVINGATCLHM